MGKSNCIYHLLFFCYGRPLECELRAQTHWNEGVNDNSKPCALHSLMKYETFRFPWLFELFYYRLPVYSTLCTVAHCSLVSIAWPNILTYLPACKCRVFFTYCTTWPTLHDMTWSRGIFSGFNWLNSAGCFAFTRYWQGYWQPVTGIFAHLCTAVHNATCKEYWKPSLRQFKSL